jgi:hypothetical protein
MFWKLEGKVPTLLGLLDRASLNHCRLANCNRPNLSFFKPDDGNISFQKMHLREHKATDNVKITIMFIHIITELFYMETYIEYQPQILSAALTLLKHLKQNVT